MCPLPVFSSINYATAKHGYPFSKSISVESHGNNTSVQSLERKSDGFHSLEIFGRSGGKERFNVQDWPKELSDCDNPLSTMLIMDIQFEW